MKAQNRSARSLLLVHAHPDDETIWTGATIARYAAEGAGVTLVTCTLGEEGNGPGGRGRHVDGADVEELGAVRARELAAACAALGVRDSRLLGGAGRYRDSGVAGASSNSDPRAFTNADGQEAAEYLCEILLETRPQVVITYDPEGLYGHPDHIKAHHVTMDAVRLAKARGLPAPTLYWIAVSARAAAAASEALAPLLGPGSAEECPAGQRLRTVPDERIAARIDAVAYTEVKLGALRAHRSQVGAVFDPDRGWLEHRAELIGIECFELAAPASPGDADPPVCHDDLFAYRAAADLVALS